jgi:periplasmic protein TonB
MAKNNKSKAAPTIEELVFENRNKDYGAYDLRKKFRKYLLIGFLISLFGVSSGVAVPFIKALMAEGKNTVLVRETVAEMSDLKTDEDLVAPPPPPPPPEAAEAQVRYTAPVIVDTVTEEVSLAIVDDMRETVSNEPVPETIEVVAAEEPVIEEEEPPFMFVEEDATFQGGDINTFRTWVQENLVHPPLAVENGISGRVTVSFVVNSKGDVTNVTVMRGVDPALDKETVRVITSSPKWTPPRQGGRAVRQQFTMPVIFQLK